MVNKDYLRSRLVSFYKLLCTEEKINYKVLHIINLYDFVLKNKEDLILYTNIKDVFGPISNSLTEIQHNENIHENLKYLLNDRINKYNEVYC